MYIYQDLRNNFAEFQLNIHKLTSNNGFSILESPQPDQYDQIIAQIYIFVPSFTEERSEPFVYLIFTDYSIESVGRTHWYNRIDKYYIWLKDTDALIKRWLTRIELRHRQIERCLKYKQELLIKIFEPKNIIRYENIGTSVQ